MGLRLREIREAKELTLEQLAARMGVSKGYLSEMERGVKTINHRRLSKAAEVLGVEARDILGRDAVDDDLAFHLDIMRDLPDEDRRDVMEYARYRQSQARDAG